MGALVLCAVGTELRPAAPRHLAAGGRDASRRVWGDVGFWSSSESREAVSGLQFGEPHVESGEVLAGALDRFKAAFGPTALKVGEAEVVACVVGSQKLSAG